MKYLGTLALAVSALMMLVVFVGMSGIVVGVVAPDVHSAIISYIEGED